MEHPQPSCRSVQRQRWASAMVLGASLGAAGVCLAQTAPLTRMAQGSISDRYSSEYALAHSPNQANSIRLFGSYYLFDPAKSNTGPVLSSLLGGFRASTGIVGLNPPVSLFDVQHEEALNVPYVGLGYSRLWFTGALSLNADVGVASQSGLTGGRMHSLFGASPSPSLDETNGDPRWAPVMAVNLRYSF
jgi:hypothetical protein